MAREKTKARMIMLGNSISKESPIVRLLVDLLE